MQPWTNWKTPERLTALLGLFTILVLPGCSAPFIDVKVSACEQSNGENNSEDGKGACNVEQVGSSTMPEICLDDTGKKVNCNNRCASGSKCQTKPGTCNRKPCKTIMLTTSKTCYCDCNYPN